jgi:hypothetical protein
MDMDMDMDMDMRHEDMEMYRREDMRPEISG